MRWVEYFRNLAHQVKLKSKDENTQIGAIIVGKDKEIVSLLKLYELITELKNVK